MHQESYLHMQRAVEQFLAPAQGPARRRVLDIGAMDVNGSFRTLFDPNAFEYLGVDLEPGPGVDQVLESPYEFPFPDNSFDVVLSGQMLEHNEFFWLTFQEKIRVLKPEGLCMMIAPSRGEIHRYPVDCYRFYPDSYRALAKFTKSQLLSAWIDTENPWGDLTGVFRKREVPEAEQFDTGTITTIGGPAKEAIKFAVQLEHAKKQLAEAQKAKAPS